MLRRVASVMLLAAVLVVGVATGSQAKGPESATLSGPGIAEPIELIHPSKSFDTYKDDAPIRLIEMLAPWYGPRATAVAPPKDLGPAFTLTWVNSGPPGDPIETRTIRQYIYPNAVGGPVVHVPEPISHEGRLPEVQEVAGWFEAPDALGTTIDEVISWSQTPEAKALRELSTGRPTTEKAAALRDKSTGPSAAEEATAGQPVGKLAADSSEASTAVSSPALIGLALAIAAGMGAVVVWRLCHSA